MCMNSCGWLNQPLEVTAAPQKYGLSPVYLGSLLTKSSKKWFKLFEKM